jgi:hypothetical protein
MCFSKDIIQLQFDAKKKIRRLIQQLSNIYRSSSACRVLTDEVRWVLNHQSSLYPILISEISWVPQISQYRQKPVTKQGQEKQTWRDESGARAVPWEQGRRRPLQPNREQAPAAAAESGAGPGRWRLAAGRAGPRAWSRARAWLRACRPPRLAAHGRPRLAAAAQGSARIWPAVGLLGFRAREEGAPEERCIRPAIDSTLLNSFPGDKRDRAGAQ